MDVAESDRSTQLCVNVTHGNVESYAYVRYSTWSGTATGKLFITFPPAQWFIIPAYTNASIISMRNLILYTECIHACMHAYSVT